MGSLVDCLGKEIHACIHGGQIIDSRHVHTSVLAVELRDLVRRQRKVVDVEVLTRVPVCFGVGGYGSVCLLDAAEVTTDIRVREKLKNF